MRKLLLALLLLGAVPAHAADNYGATAGSGLTFAAKDVASGGILYPWTLLANSAGVELFTSGNPGLMNPATAASWGVGATGAAVPANAHYVGIISGGNLVGWTGAVTANAGTNLNTSLLALEGGNLATIAGAITSSVEQTNLKQVNGVTTQAGSGAVGTGSQRVAVGQDTTTIAGSAPGTAGAPSANVVSVQGAASMTPLLVTPSGGFDPCTTLAKTPVPISQTANTKLVTKVSAKKTYICSIMVVAADAENVSLVEGTQTTNPCDTSTAAIIGGTTAAAGPNLAANGGWTLGAGGFSVAFGANNNFDVCLFQSGSGRVAGVLTYVQN
jgi:hypothetical protein